MAAALESIVPELTGQKIVEKRAEFLALISEGQREAQQDPIRQLLADYVAQKKPNFRDRARGYNFPRAQIEAHLRDILERHRDLIDDPDGFIAALFLKPSGGSREENRRAIFHYNRKTTEEIEAIWARKVRNCPMAGWLGLPPDTKVGTNGDPAVRRWALLEYLATRSLEVQITPEDGDASQANYSSHRPSAALIAGLVATVDAPAAPDWKAVKRAVLDDAAATLPGAREIPGSQSPYSRDFFAQLQELACPSAAYRKRRGNLSPESAGRLYEIATDGGRDFSPEGIGSRLEAIGFFDWHPQPGSEGVPYPQVTFLMGQRKKNGHDAGKLAVPGRLHRIFESLRDRLGGQTAPDYCVLEVAGTLPRNTEQKREIELDRKERRAQREKLFAEYGREDGAPISRRRVELFDQQRGRCPYTGRDLVDPHHPELNIDHIIPQSRGGLSVDQNLVLTFRTVNHGELGKGDRTPREAADAGLPGFLPWPEMLRNVSDMKWGKPRAYGQPGGDRKIDVFTFVPTPEVPVPDFGSATRTMHLTRQLVEEMATWMGIAHDGEARAHRIGMPSGWHIAQARRSWLPGIQSPSRILHYLMDAAVLAHLPPREGLNHIRYAGIFFPDHHDSVDATTGKRRFRPVTRALPELGPDLGSLAPLLYPEPTVCPVEKHRPRKRTASLGDATFWRLDTATGSTYQRSPLTPDRFTTPGAVETALRNLRIPPDLMPSHQAIADWLGGGAAGGESLRLRNGTPVRHGAKRDGKGSLRSPAGWSGATTPDGAVTELRALSAIYDRLEVWLGWDGAKWAYYRRVVPDRVARRHLERFVPTWDDGVAPAWMQSHPERPETYKSVEEIICGPRPPEGSVKVRTFRRGDVFCIHLNADGGVADSAETAVARSWYHVSAIKSSGEIEFACLLYRNRQSMPMAAFTSDKCLKPRTSDGHKLAFIGGLPAPDITAGRLGLRPTPANASRRDTVPAPVPGETG